MTDQEIRDLVEPNLRLVFKIAREYTGRGLHWDDLVAEGNYGMLLAAHRFDPARGVKFSTYSAWWIRQLIRRALQEQTQSIRVPFQTKIKLLHIQRTGYALKARLSREPTDEEIAAELGILPRTVTELKRIGSVLVTSLNLPVPGREDGEELVELLPDLQMPHPDMQLSHAEELENLLALVKDLPPREQRIIERRFGLRGQDSMTLKEVAGEMDLTIERVRQLQNKALARLFQAMTSKV